MSNEVIDGRKTMDRRKLWEESIIKKYGSMQAFKEEAAKHGSVGGKFTNPKKGFGSRKDLASWRKGKRG